jgi:hypothetical protein
LAAIFLSYVLCRTQEFYNDESTDVDYQ